MPLLVLRMGLRCQAPPTTSCPVDFPVVGDATAQPLLTNTNNGRNGRKRPEPEISLTPVVVFIPSHPHVLLINKCHNLN